MSFYKVLNKQIFRDDKFAIVPIRIQDRYDIMRWRNEQMYHLRQDKPLNHEIQDKYFEEVIGTLFDQDQPTQILFSYLERDRCIGYGGLVHINWIDRNAEISFLMDTSLETHFFKRNWLSFLALIQELAFEELNLHKVYTYAFDLRPHLYDVLESAGFKREAVLPEHCLFESRYIDVVIHSKFNRQIFLRPVEKSDFEITYAWAVNPIIRAYALNQSPITRESHKSWFLKKEKDKSCLFYIAEYNSKPAGAFRLDLNKDGSALISYLLDSQYHNLGLGTALLRAGIEKAKCQPEISALIGQVLKDNKASVRIFEKLDFDLIAREDGLNTYQLVIR